jgi:hypothetical protein
MSARTTYIQSTVRVIVGVLVLAACSTGLKPPTVAGQWGGYVRSQTPGLCDVLGWTLQQSDTAIAGSWSLAPCGIAVAPETAGGVAGSIVADSVTIFFNGSIFGGHLSANGDTLVGTLTGGALGVASLSMARK